MAAVGAKLLNENGTIQEAGGIIYADGSGCNYGRGWVASDPRSNYARPVDYCSGAALLVRTDLFFQIGGFDSDFAPAYYEDTNLCFELRRLGYEVWYEPNSIVIHFEGISHGKDTSTGIKSYQEINRVKFLSKWTQDLEKHLESSPDLTHRAAHRQYKRRILIIDHRIPTPDLDSGSLRIYELIKSMRELGCFVTFLSQEMFVNETYSEKLESLDVEIFTISGENIDLVKSRGAFYDFIWASRPEPTRFFRQELENYFAGVPMIYDTVDLHFLRLKRIAQLTQDGSVYRESILTQIVELENMRHAKKVVVVSDFESNLLSSFTQTPIYVLPNVHTAVNYVPGIENRDGLLFVGGFEHQPNGDAMNWFISEILPLVLKQCPGIKLRIVGSKCPSWLQELNHPNIEVLGWVKDLAPIYAQSRVCIAPLRYGAGIKGKVGEAMSHGVPTVLTNVAAEGMGLVPRRHCLIADNPDEFANEIVSLVSDNQIWQTISEFARDHANDNYSQALAKSRIKQLLEI